MRYPCADHQTVPEESAWHVIRTQPRHELSAALLLSTRFEQYLPSYPANRSHARQIQETRRPLFPSYLFCKFPYTERHVEVLRTPGVLRESGIVRFLGRPATLSDTEIAAIREMEARGAYPVKAEWRVGDRVEALGMSGIITVIRDEQHVVIRAYFMQRMVEVKTNAGTLRAA